MNTPNLGTIAPDPNRIIDVSSQSGSDTTKFQTAFKKAADDPYKTVYVPWVGKEYLIEDEVIAKRADNDFVQFNVKSDPCWKMIDFKAPDNMTCFRLFGFKQGSIDSLMIRTYGNGHTGFCFEGTEKIDSSSGWFARNCRVQSWQGHSCVGFLTGRNGNDYSASVFQQCEFYGNNPSSPVSNLAPDYLNYTYQRNHKGFVFNGGNNLYQVLRDCRAVDAKVAVSQMGVSAGINSGGSGLVVDNFGTTACNLVFQTDGGFPFYARGGRHEIGGALLVHGSPNGWQGATVPVRLSDMIVDGFRPNAGAGTDLFTPGALLTLKSCSKYRFEGLAFSTIDGELTGPNAVILAHNGGPNSNGSLFAQVNFDDCVLSFNPYTQTKVLQGHWNVFQDRTLVKSV